MEYYVYIVHPHGFGKTIFSPTLSGGADPGIYPMGAGEQIRGLSFWLGADALGEEDV